MSDVARTAVKIIREYQAVLSIPMMSKAEFSTVGDYLMTIICINNGSRAGPIANMRMNEYNDARKEGDSFVVLVRKHKTYQTYGPAHIILSSTL